MNFSFFGYSGHAQAVLEIALANDFHPVGYYDLEIKEFNPYKLKYLGNKHISSRSENVFISIGDNNRRNQIFNTIEDKSLLNFNIISKCSSISKNIEIGFQNFIGRLAIINSNVSIGNGCIINSGSIVEHDCKIDNFVHVAPAAVVAGGVSIGENSFIGANSFIKQNVSIGKNTIIGAGSVVLNDIEDNITVYGNPVKND